MSSVILSVRTDGLLIEVPPLENIPIIEELINLIKKELQTSKSVEGKQ